MIDISKWGKPSAIRPVEVECRMDDFDNAVREFGVTNACEWFGHEHNSDFTRETIEVLCERSGVDCEVKEL